MVQKDLEYGSFAHQSRILVAKVLGYSSCSESCTKNGRFSEAQEDEITNFGFTSSAAASKSDVLGNSSRSSKGLVDIC